MKKRVRLTPQSVVDKGHNYNLRSTKENKFVDRISQLEDELLVSILSLLPLKKAAATSILSRRWRYAWASTLNLNFDPDEEMLGSLSYQSNPKIQEVERRKYVNWVNDVVERHRGSNVQHVRFSFDLDYKFSSHIDKWIQFAMKKGVQVLELDFLYNGVLFRGSGNCYAFPHEVLGVKTGSASRPVCCDVPTLHPNMYSSFKTLRVLHFKAVAVDGGVLECILSNCPLLEQLSVFNSPNLAKLRVCGPSIALKYLVIEACDAIKHIEICDASLVSFIYSGHKPTLLLLNVPFLVEVSVFQHASSCYFNEILSDVFTQLPCCLSQLEIIKAIPSRVYRKNRVLPMLANVKHLELAFAADSDDSLLHLNSFIKASPHLHKLILHVHGFGNRGPVTYKKAAKFSHHYLNEVEIAGLAGFFPWHSFRPCHIQLVQYFTEIAVRLEKIIITRTWNNSKYLYWCFPRQRLRGEREERYERIRSWEQLNECAPSIIELAGQ
ncbi:hypothetical protein M0R45_016671 [Rubus argutus]|uniref:Uncharacterized protein n=1 Tax=Rubus argutus TaxID=59490 RepID=A0AAW1XU04_RUBAR